MTRNSFDTKRVPNALRLTLLLSTLMVMVIVSRVASVNHLVETRCQQGEQGCL